MKYFTKIGLMAAVMAVLSFASIKVASAQDEPVFAMTPTSHTFQDVGLLNGDIVYPGDTVTFEVSNIGGGDLVLTDAPYLFSANNNQFALIDDNSYPATITEADDDNVSFKVVFKPSASGDKTTQLVITDDIVRLVRTFDLFGTAFDVEEGDLLANAYEITNDFHFTHDYTHAGILGGYHDDYATEGLDAVYTLSFDKTSNLNVTAEEATYVSLYEAGSDLTGAPMHGGESLEIEDLQAGDYVLVVDGTGHYTLNVFGETAYAEFAVEPASIDLGFVPLNAWHKGGEFKLWNAGNQVVNIASATESDVEDVFTITSHVSEYPYEITTDTVPYNVYLNGAQTAGVYNGALLIEDDVTTRVLSFTGTAYEAEMGDIVEKPFLVALNPDGHYEQTGSVAAPMHINYDQLTATASDVVFQLSYDKDFVLDIALTAAAGSNLAIYNAADFAGNTFNTIIPVVVAESITARDMAAGNYYVILSAEEATPDYTIEIDVLDMPSPGEVALVSPVDASEEVDINPTLTWTYGEYTQQITVLCGTTYPPTEVVYQGVPVSEYTIEDDLMPANVYFWQVIATNTNDTTTSELWAFTTTLPMPHHITGEIVDYTNVHLSWFNPFEYKIKINEDFEGDVFPPAGWTATTNSVSSTGGWTASTANGSDYFEIPAHTTYASTNDDAADDDGSVDFLTMPVVGMEDFQTGTLSFESLLGKYGHKGMVKITNDGGDTYEIIAEMEQTDDWSAIEIDLADYLNENYDNAQIVFHSDDDGGYTSGWAIDDIKLDLVSIYGNGYVQGYNVYQNGEQINEELVEGYEYDVMDLDAGTYTFCITAVYAEGESDYACIDPIIILGETTVSGNVTYVGGTPLEGATVTFAGIEGDGPFVATTDADGNYSIVVPILANGYNVTASMTGYESAVEENPTMAANTPLTLDFVLGDIALPASNVVATYQETDDNVKVTWGEPVASGDTFFEGFEAGIPDTWTIVDNDGDGYNWMLGQAPSYATHTGDGCAVSESWSNPNALTPDNWLITPAVAIGVDAQFKFWYVGQDADYAAEVFHIMVSTSDNAVASFTDNLGTFTASEDWQQGVIDLSAYIGQTIHIAINHTDVTDMFVLNIDDVELVEGTTMAVAQGTIGETATGMPFRTSDMSAEEINTKLAAYNATGSRELEHYNVYRFLAENADDETTWGPAIAENVTEYETIDNDWATLDAGVYQYAVKTVYTMNESAPAFSNTVEKDMRFQAIVEVTLNTDESAAGTVVTFTHANGEEQEMEVDANGLAHFYDLFKGAHTLKVAKACYSVYEESVEIFDNAFIREVGLVEILAPAVELEAVASCMDVNLTWEEGDACSTDRSLENFIVYRDGENIGETTETTFVDADLVGGTYEYTIEAVYTSGSADLTAVTSVEVADIVPATNVVANKISNNNVELTWDAVAGAVSYDVLRTKNQEPAEEVATGLTETTFVQYDIVDAGNYTYTVITHFTGGCEAISEASDAVVITDLGAELAAAVKVYPNPASTYFQVELPEGFETVKVINALGQVVETVNVTEITETIDLSDYTAGTYMIQAVTSEGTVINKQLVVTK